MSNLQGNVHNCRMAGPQNLQAILSGLNHHLYEHSETNRYATIFFGCYDDDTHMLNYVSCGHTPSLLPRKGGVERLGATATVRGLFRSWECSIGKAQIEPGDGLSIFSDGVTETTASNGDEFGEAHLLSALETSRRLESSAILRNVEQEWKTSEPENGRMTI